MVYWVDMGGNTTKRVYNKFHHTVPKEEENI
jgi:hypothetical protein